MNAAGLHAPRSRAAMIRRPWSIVLFLSALNLINYVDRSIVAAVGPRMQDALALSDLRFGFVINAFMLGYFLTSPVFGVLGDRFPRKAPIAFGVAAWSVATVASGFAGSFAAMVATRVAVGIGEASYATLAPTIIDDLAEPSRKNRFLAVFYVAIPIGSALGYVLGGELEALFGWRSAFFVVGAPGIALALATLWIAEPARELRSAQGATTASEASIDSPAAMSSWRTQASGVARDFRQLGQIALYRDAVLGYVAYTFALGGFAAWAPKYLYRELHMDLRTADFWFGAILVVAGLLATFVGGACADRWPGADRPKANLRFCAITAAAAVPPALLCLLAPTATGFFVAIGLAEFALFLSTSPINVVILQGVPAPLRASAMAISIFAIHLLGDLISPPLIGAISDHWSLRGGMFLLPAALTWGAWFWWKGSGVSHPDTA